MNPVGAVITAFLLLVVFLGPRHWALMAMVAGALYLTQEQAVSVVGLNMFPTRFLEMAGFVRVIMRRELTFSKLGGIDRMFVITYLYLTVVFLLRSTEAQAYQVGILVDATLCYFTFRGLIGGIEDFQRFLRSFLFLLMPYLALLLLERFTGYNVFTFFGGGLPPGMEWLREGAPRCMGSFRHPTIAGVLGASFLSLYIARAFSPDDRKLAVIGIFTCLGIVFTSNSAGPLGFTVAALTGWLLWNFRDRLNMVRLGALCMIVITALVMKAPIWYLISKASAFTGGTGWHRAFLMEVTYQHIGSWWLAGMPIPETATWFPYTLVMTGGADITNQFVQFALSAGLGALLLLILLYAKAFRTIGDSLAAVRSVSAEPGEAEFLLWGLGCMLMGHLFTFTAITYFDQFHLIWFMQFAAISNISADTIEFTESEIMAYEDHDLAVSA